MLPGCGSKIGTPHGSPINGSIQPALSWRFHFDPSPLGSEGNRLATNSSQGHETHLGVCQYSGLRRNGGTPKIAAAFLWLPYNHSKKGPALIWVLDKLTDFQEEQLLTPETVSGAARF